MRYEEQFTVCSNAHCYKSAAITNDPAHPPFCEECKKKSKNRPENAER